MRTALKLLFLSILIFSISIQAEPTSDQSIEQLLQLTKTEKLMTNMLAPMHNMVRNNLRQAINGKTLTADQQAIVDKQIADRTSIIDNEFTWDKIRNVYIQAYRETFSQEEIDGLIAFYKTPVGQAFVDKQPELQQHITTFMQPHMLVVIQKMQQTSQGTIQGLSGKN